MFDEEQLQGLEETSVSVPPCDAIFHEVGSNTYTFVDLLSELDEYF